MHFTIEDYKRALGRASDKDTAEYIQSKLNELYAVEEMKRQQKFKEDADKYGYGASEMTKADEFALHRGVTEIPQEEANRAVTDFQDMLIQKAQYEDDIFNRPPVNRMDMIDRLLGRGGYFDLPSPGPVPGPESIYPERGGVVPPPNNLVPGPSGPPSGGEVAPPEYVAPPESVDPMMPSGWGSEPEAGLLNELSAYLKTLDEKNIYIEGV